jgi:hypothetical protein
MIEDKTLVWGTFVLILCVAFLLIPGYRNIEKYQNILGVDPRNKTPDPPVAPGWLFPGGNDYLSHENYENYKDNRFFVWPIRESFTESSTKPSGVRVLPSQSMPPPSVLEDMNTTVGTDKKQLGTTLPPPDYSDSDSSVHGRDQYVLKSSLVPCTCPTHGMSCPRHGGSYPASTVPGSCNADEDIQKPFSAAFPGENEPIGFLNSFSAFMK